MLPICFKRYYFHYEVKGMASPITDAAVEICKQYGGILSCLRHGSWWSVGGWCDEVGRRCYSPQIRAEDSLCLITSERLSLHIQSFLLFPFYCACILVVNEPDCKLCVKWSRLKMCVSFNFWVFLSFIAGKLEWLLWIYHAEEYEMT